ncbi:hypothetical protein F2Q69_00010273 [Brassica cretica]|uniref:RNA helicase n=1 Tax=Brassica cretica TaxID=69181 RepID=A0A8S9R9V2_BRACR|nr:hypothetical protein F2Q69_00010273 [Brassica cretica]
MSNRSSQQFRGGDNSEDTDVDNIDFIENEEEVEDDVHNGGSAAANDGDDEEIDPLDAFMEGIPEEMKSAPPPKLKAKAERYKDDDDHVVSFVKAKKDLGLTLAADALNAGNNSDEEVYAAAKAVDAGMLEYDSDDNPIVVDKRKIEPIQALDHSSVDYEPINKDFYEEYLLYPGMSEQEALDYRHSLGIRVSGFDVRRPVKTFEDCGFSSQIMSAIKKQAYEKPTTIQCQALPIVLSGRDIIGIAKTGSGKTAAFVLPMIVHIMDQTELRREEGPIGVICAPTRELAHQIYLEAKKFSKAYGLRVSAVYGGMGKHEQFRELKAGCEIVVATPGRLIDMLKMKALTMMRASYLVLDEADRMFDLGFEPQVRSIVGQIRPDRQTLLFSATMPWKVEKLAREILSDPIRATVGEAGMANEDITQVVNATVDEIEAQLTLNAFKVAALHGDKDQASRIETLQKFKSGVYHVLVATDVAARGLDIKSLKTVVNYDTAKDMDMHVHRIGRTGRAGDKDGVAYTLVTQREARFAGELINSLVAAGQNDGRFKSKRDGRKGGGKKGRGRGGGGNRGVRGVDFGLGIGFNSESSGTLSQAAPSRKGVINSVRTGVMAQFKNSFVAAATPSNPQSQGGYPNKRPSLMGFVSGGTIGGDMGRTQSQTPPVTASHNSASLHNASQKNPQRFDSF